MRWTKEKPIRAFCSNKVLSAQFTLLIEISAKGCVNGTFETRKSWAICDFDEIKFVYVLNLANQKGDF